MLGNFLRGVSLLSLISLLSAGDCSDTKGGSVNKLSKPLEPLKQSKAPVFEPCNDKSIAFCPQKYLLKSAIEQKPAALAELVTHLEKCGVSFDQNGSFDGCLNSPFETENSTWDASNLTLASRVKINNQIVMVDLNFNKKQRQPNGVLKSSDEFYFVLTNIKLHLDSEEVVLEPLANQVLAAEQILKQPTDLESAYVAFSVLSQGVHLNSPTEDNLFTMAEGLKSLIVSSHDQAQYQDQFLKHFQEFFKTKPTIYIDLAKPLLNSKNALVAQQSAVILAENEQTSFEITDLLCGAIASENKPISRRAAKVAIENVLVNHIADDRIVPVVKEAIKTSGDLDLAVLLIQLPNRDGKLFTGLENVIGQGLADPLSWDKKMKRNMALVDALAHTPTDESSKALVTILGKSIVSSKIPGTPLKTALTQTDRKLEGLEDALKKSVSTADDADGEKNGIAIDALGKIASKASTKSLVNLMTKGSEKIDCAKIGDLLKNRTLTSTQKLLLRGISNDPSLSANTICKNAAAELVADQNP